MSAGRTVSVLFTDLVGSTELMARLGDSAFDRLRHDHFARLRAAVGEHQGDEVKNTGDGLLVTFASAVDALRAAVAVQQAAALQGRAARLDLSVRVGLAIGEVALEDDDVFGTPVVEASRLVAAARPGQILATAMVRAMAGSRADVTFVDLEPLVAKGLPGPVAVCQVQWSAPPSVASPFPGRPAARGLPSDEWPLCGREQELAAVARLIGDPARGGVLLVGPAGVGKSRLADECVLAAERVGLATARAAATRSARDLPFGALAPFLPASPGAALDLAGFLRHCCETIAQHGGGARLVLCVDDAHLLDEASATLTHQLVLTGSAFVLATLRSGEVAPDAVSALWREGLTERIDLAPLSPDAVASLLAAVLGGPVEAATVAHVSARCGGNALFLREVVVGAVAAGTIREDGGTWHLTGELTPSRRLTEIVEDRLGRLSETEQTFLEAVALGEPLGAAEITALGGNALAESLERKGLLASRADGRRLELRLAHPLYGDVLRADLSPLRARTLHAALAEAVWATGPRRRGDALRVATWRLADGNADAGLLLAGAREAHARFDLGLAERLARAAVDAGGGFEASLLAAQLVNFSGRVDEAEAALAALAGRAANDVERGVVAVTRIDNLFFGTSRWEEPARICEEAEAIITDRAWLDEIAVRRAAITIRTEGPGAGVAILEPILRGGPGEGRAYVWACYFGGIALAKTGRLAEAAEAAHRGHAAYLALTGPPLQFPPEMFPFIRCEALVQAGRAEEAERQATESYDQAVSIGSIEIRALFAWYRARARLARGRLDSAVGDGREAAQKFRELRRPVFVAHSLGVVAMAAAQRGDAAVAEAAAAEARNIGLPPHNMYGVDAVASRAWAAVAAGDLDGARRLLADAAHQGAETGDLTGRCAALHDLARLGRSSEVADAVAEVAAQIEGDLAPARAAHVRALAAADPSALEVVSDRFEAMGSDLLAAEAAADAAVAWSRAGDPRRAAAAGRRARTLAGRCEGAATPALQSISSRARLTPAERDVAMLAAAGRSNPEIAQTLVLSRRTVENYLHRAYEKLGISSRDHLAEALET